MKKNYLVCCMAMGAIMTATSCGYGFDASKNITLYSREAGSGTRECFFEGIGYSDVKAEDNWLPGVSVHNESSNSSMMEAIKNDLYGIGFCSLDSLDDVDGIKGLKFNDVAANEENVLNGDYQLKRNFNYVIKDYESLGRESEQQAVDGFIDFLTKTSEGLNIIKTNGGIISNNDSLPSWNTIIDQYPVFKGEEELTINFCGSTSVKKIIEAAVEKIEGTQTKVHYVLNQNGSGDAVKGITTGLNGKECGIGFLSRELKNEELSLLNENNKHGSFAIDAVVPIVNENNTAIDGTTAQQLTAFYKGEIKTWNEVNN